MMRVIFFGTAAFAVPALEHLARAKHTVVMCVTQPDRPQGRGLKVTASPVKQAAEALGLPVSQPARPTAELFAELRPDVGVLAAYGQLIRRDVLGLPKHGILGIHPSLLPKYRGAAPVAWALLNGERETGVTIYRLVERLDAGDVISQQVVAVDPEEDAENLTGRLATLGAQELLGSLEAIHSGQATWIAQDDARATLAPKLTKNQGRIDWSASADAIHALVRALVPWPSAYTGLRGEGLKILKTSVESSSRPTAKEPPGTVIGASADGIRVATGGGLLAVHTLQPAGKRRMTAKEFLAGHALKPGDRLADA